MIFGVMASCEQEGAVRERRERLETVWQTEQDQDLVYSKQNLLPSRDIHWDEVQWAANVVRSRFALDSRDGPSLKFRMPTLCCYVQYYP